MKANRTIISGVLAGLMSGMSLITPAALACDIEGKSGILPKNNMRISAMTRSLNGIDERVFNAVIDRVTKIYAPIVAKKGARLSVEKRWTDETVNAFADRQGMNWSVHMFGGLARHPAITMDGFMLVVCHELGHHLGGAPKYESTDWASNEGQADYFGTLKCMRRVLTESPDFTRPRLAVDPTVQSGCMAAHRDARDQQMCVRIGMAGKSLADLFAAFGGPAPKFDTPDKTVVNKTFDAHPKSQCRLDTYFQASLCTKPYLDDVDDRDPTRGVCIAADGFKVGVRPLCWYKPTPAEGFRRR
jgi:hypothetical protein